MRSLRYTCSAVLAFALALAGTAAAAPSSQPRRVSHVPACAATVNAPCQGLMRFWPIRPGVMMALKVVGTWR